jgi:SAM-dependent methyltransferase
VSGERRVVAGGPTDWWKGFFDEAYVRAWESDGAFQSTDDAVVDLLSFLQLEPGAAILDIPCGFGRFAGPLHEAGYDVVGVDAAPDQIRLARENHPGPRYVLGDMRAPPAGPFDAVMNLYSSFGYFEDPEDDVNCLRAWYRVLRPGGTLVLESMHRDRLAWLWGQEPDPGTRREAGTTDWKTGVRTSYVQVDGETRMFRLRLYTATDLVGMMAETGFTSIEVYGGLDGSPLDPSTRLAIRARR